jgi:hypothetical protein
MHAAAIKISHAIILENFLVCPDTMISRVFLQRYMFSSKIECEYEILNKKACSPT